MANAVEPAVGNGYEGRPPRLPRWTRQEILVLIEGKRVVESRGKGRGLNRAGGLVGSGNPVEPKWASVSSYCRRHGVNRGPVQCRKRWSNLAGDFKKIKEWESGKKEEESFWAMRNDLRRVRRLPGFFDREVYDILDGASGVEAEEAEEAEVKKEAAAAAVEEEEVVFDSGRPAAEDGLFSDFEEEKEAAEEEEEEEEERPAVAEPPAAAAVMPISGMAKDKQPSENPEKVSSPSQEGQKRRRTSQEGSGDTSLQNQLIEVLERNSRMLTAQLEAQNVNYQLDRDQRKDQTDGLLGVLSKVADALGRIADKL